MTERPDEERQPQEEAAEEENPVEELLEGFEKVGWRPANAPWGETERRRIEMEKRREELMIAWRRRRIQPASRPEDSAPEDERGPEKDEEEKRS